MFTTRSTGSTADVLRSYRTRWQIELVFKRLKSLAQLGHVPKHDDRGSRAWLYGKLLVTLLAQQLIRIGRDISPLGLLTSGAGDDVVRRVNLVLRFTRSSKLLNRTSPCKKTLYSWNQIAEALAENSRNRLLQLAKWMPREHRFKTN